MSKPVVTLYQIADREIRSCIVAYLKLAKDTIGLSRIEEQHVADERTRTILLAGLGVSSTMTAREAVEEWKRRYAIPFDLETAIAAGVYRDIREAGGKFLEALESSTNAFTKFDADYIYQNPYLLPLLQHLAGVFSKAALKKQVGQVSDTGISKPAAQRLAKLLEERVDASKVNKGEILQRLESTLEGIVRDLVGRVLLESIVESALLERNVSFQREEDYDSLPGVVYDFRADFVVPNAKSPVAFIEVRKSSSRHASLYAKDKMFSAINWKGHNSKMLAVLVVDGEWTGETLRVMAKVFDYVVPISRVAELVQTLSDYLAGDKTKLKWLIEFKISDASKN
jgi:hypothetical protein